MVNQTPRRRLSKEERKAIFSYNMRIVPENLRETFSGVVHFEKIDSESYLPTDIISFKNLLTETSGIVSLGSFQFYIPKLFNKLISKDYMETLVYSPVFDVVIDFVEGGLKLPKSKIPEHLDYHRLAKTYGIQETEDPMHKKLDAYRDYFDGDISELYDEKKIDVNDYLAVKPNSNKPLPTKTSVLQKDYQKAVEKYKQLHANDPKPKTQLDETDRMKDENKLSSSS